MIAVADEVTVMRNGRVVAQRSGSRTDASELSRLMVGRDIDRVLPRAGGPGDVVLSCQNLIARNDRQTVALNGLSLQVRAGEILGVTGVDGNGQRELSEVIAGLRAVDAGKIEVDGRDIGQMNARKRLHEAGIAFVPEDRHFSGLVLDQPIATNLALRRFYRRPVSRFGLLDRGRIMADADTLIGAYGIRARSSAQPAAALSGGNQQKVILARELDTPLRVLMVVQPTKGLDVGAIEFVQRKVLDQRAKGAAVLYISTELEHVVEVADRIAVIHRGRISGTLPSVAATAERVGLLMAGVSRETAQ